MLKRDFVQRIRKSATTAAKAEEVDTTPHELTNIRVEEVSLVDAPANRRKFLVTKRDRTLKAGGDDVAAASTEVAVVDAADLVDLAARPTVTKTDLPGADLDRADAARLKAERDAEEAADRARELALTATVKADPPKEEADPVPAPDPVPPAPEPTPPAPEPTPPAPVADPDLTPTPVIEEKVTAKAEPVEKVGKPMQRARLDRLKASLKSLSELVNELDVDSEEPTAKTVAGLDMSMAEIEAFLGKVGKSGDMIYIDNGKLRLGPAPAVVVATKSEPTVSFKEDPNAAEIKRLSTMVETLSKMVGEQGAQLAKSKMPVNSNAISLEKSQTDHDKVYWDVDMASPAARLKGRSF